MKIHLSAALALVVLSALIPVSAQNTFTLSSTLSQASGIYGINGPDSVATADVNGDGKPDLICANGVGYTVLVLTNTGHGVFKTAATLTMPASQEAGAVMAADVLGNGKQDIICIGVSASPIYAGTITVFTNEQGLNGNQNLSFSSGTTYNVGRDPGSLRVADVNGDGKLDLICANALSNSLSIFTNNGSGGFGSNATINVGLAPYSVTTADVNRDGSVDLVCCNYSNNTVIVLTNNGSGIFGSNATLNVLSPSTVVAADIRGGGWPDLIVESVTNFNRSPSEPVSTLTVWTNNGSGGFGSNVSFTVGSVGERVMDVHATNLFADGNLDLVFTVASSLNNEPGYLMVYTNNGSGGFGSNLTVTVGTSYTLPESAAVADVNGDGSLDLVTENYGGNSLTVFTNSGNGIQSGSFLSNSLPVAGTNVNFVLAADLYRNGRSQLIAPNGGNPLTLLILTNNGSGMFGSNAVVSGFAANNYQISSPPIAADIFGNGLPALIIGVKSLQFNSGLLTVLTNNGSGAFGTNFSFSTGNSPPVAIFAADVNGDGKLDLVVNCQQNGFEGYLLVLTNNGSGGFGTNVTVQENNGAATAMAVADINGDGRPDLITAFPYSGGYSQMTVYMNIGVAGAALYSSSSGSYTTTYQVSPGASPSALAVADLLGNGRMDVIIANNNNPGTLSVITNSGIGTYGYNNYTFGLASSPTVGPYPHALAAQDVNGDGKVDLISANWGPVINTFDQRAPLNWGTLTVLTNNGSGVFTNPATFSTGKGPTAVIALDVNGDGRPDLITANYTSFTNSSYNSFDYGTGTTFSVFFNISNSVNTVVLQTAPTNSIITYGQTLSATGLGGGAVTNELGVTMAGTFAFITNSVPGAGTSNYPVIFTVTPPTDYQPITFNESVTVNQLVAILKGRRAFDGTTNAVFGILSVSNKVGSDNVVVASGTGGLPAANVGTNSITSLNDLALGGTAAGNYTLIGAGGSVVITQAVPVVMLSSSLNPSGYGAGVSFTATLPSFATGTVQFLTNGVNFDLEPLSTGSAGSVTTAALPVGTNIITAAYSGDANDRATSNNLAQAVNLPLFSPAMLGSGGLVMSGSYGIPYGTYYILSSTNMSLPASQWTPVLTNQFDASGNYTFTNPIAPSPGVYFILEVQTP